MKAYRFSFVWSLCALPVYNSLSLPALTPQLWTKTCHPSTSFFHKHHLSRLIQKSFLLHTIKYFLSLIHVCFFLSRSSHGQWVKTSYTTHLTPAHAAALTERFWGDKQCSQKWRYAADAALLVYNANMSTMKANAFYQWQRYYLTYQKWHLSSYNESQKQNINKTDLVCYGIGLHHILLIVSGNLCLN